MSVGRIFLIVLLLNPALAWCADDDQVLQKILERLQHLEEQNQQLTEEVRALRSQIATQAPANETPGQQEPQPSLAERTTAVEQRTSDLDQAKVEASQRFPIKVTGMALFNAFINSHNNGGAVIPQVASPGPWPSISGASFRQTTLGLSFYGPEFAGAKISGSVDADFHSTGTYNANVLQTVRLKTAVMNMDWKNQSVSFGIEAPLISPRSPSSLAEVAVPPLSGAGNLWLWQPQFRIEQRFPIGDTMGVRLQGSVYQTNELGYDTATSLVMPEQSRPAYEGRVEFWSHPSSSARYEIASGFHLSKSHVVGASIPSRLFSTDWLISPWRKLTWTGTFFYGQDITGIGGVGPGYWIEYEYNRVREVMPVHAIGGWTQLAFQVTPRLTVNAFVGEQANRAADLDYGTIARNLAYAGNVMFRIAPNILTGVEAMQIRTLYLGHATRLQNRYDLALAYLF